MTWHIGGGIWQPATEDSLASRLGETQAGRLRYCHDARAWFVYDGALWRRDRTGVAAGRVRELARELCTAPGGERTAASGKPGFVAGALRFAAQEPALAVTAAAWDVDPWLLGTPEGPVDLRTGAPAAADPRDGLSRAAVAPDPPGTVPPAWCRFLDETFGGDAALIDFLQRFFGSALTGATAERVVVLGCGPGAGKQTLLASVLHVMGEYAALAEPAASAGPAPRGTRLVALGQGAFDRGALGQGAFGNAALGNAGLARLAGAPVRLFAIADAAPRLAEPALRRRLLVVPFRHRPAQPDRGLVDRLKAEAPAILRWMIDGALAWQAHGLDPPAAVAAATCDDDPDTLDAFLAERCERAPDGVATAAELWHAWRDFAADEGEPAGSQRLFAAALAARGFARDRSETARFYRGLALRPRADA